MHDIRRDKNMVGYLLVVVDIKVNQEKKFKPSWKKVTPKILQHVLRSLDPHTRFQIFLSGMSIERAKSEIVPLLPAELQEEFDYMYQKQLKQRRDDAKARRSKAKSSETSTTASGPDAPTTTPTPSTKKRRRKSSVTSSSIPPAEPGTKRTAEETGESESATSTQATSFASRQTAPITRTTATTEENAADSTSTPLAPDPNVIEQYRKNSIKNAIHDICKKYNKSISRALNGGAAKEKLKLY